MSLVGKGAVVTGGGRGIGAATAAALALQGARVVVTARSVDQLAAVVEGIKADGGEAYAIECDVGDPDAITAMAAESRERLGSVDVLVNNAGISPTSPFQKVTLEEWERSHRINATGPLLCTQAFLPEMLAAGWGRVVNVASVVSYTGSRYITSYAASKHALLGMTRCLAVELIGSGVTANCVCPGYVDTPMTDGNVQRVAAKTGKSPESVRSEIAAHAPGGRLVSVDEVVHGILNYVSDLAGSMNGSSLVIDGGGLLP